MPAPDPAAPVHVALGPAASESASEPAPQGPATSESAAPGPGSSEPAATVPTEVLAAFGLAGVAPVRLAGGQGTAWLAGQVVIKPADIDRADRWNADVYDALAGPGFRVPRPVRAEGGDWIAHGWTAWQRVSGAAADWSAAEDFFAKESDIDAKTREELAAHHSTYREAAHRSGDLIGGHELGHAIVDAYGIQAGTRWLNNSSRMKTIRSYAQKREHQRREFGRDVSSRTQTR